MVFRDMAGWGTHPPPLDKRTDGKVSSAAEGVREVRWPPEAVVRALGIPKAYCQVRKTMKRAGVLAMAVCVLLVAPACQAAVAMPSYSLSTVIDGQLATSKWFQGQAVLVTFFAI
jgi:hypothetical protein